MATYAIGDLQGCYHSLCALLEHIQFNPEQDRLWFVGDLVNRGRDSLRVLRLVKNLGDRATVVLGNHDLYLLMVAYGAIPLRAKDDTLDEVLQAPDREELLEWLRRRPLMHLDNGYAMVHAGLLPQWTAQQARRLAAEVEGALAGPHFREVLMNIWGNKPDEWHDSLHGYERFRAIINAMTRMRFCTSKGVMDFKVKGEIKNAPKGYIPWFEIPAAHHADTTIVCGHWSALGLKTTPRLLAIDTGCLWGRQLTAVRLEDRKIFQVNSRDTL